MRYTFSYEKPMRETTTQLKELSKAFIKDFKRIAENATCYMYSGPSNEWMKQIEEMESTIIAVAEVPSNAARSMSELDNDILERLRSGNLL